MPVKTRGSIEPLGIINKKLIAMDRKKFLQYSAMAGAASLLAALEGFALQEEKILRVALIGCGSVSNRYIPHLQASRLIRIVSLCDIKYQRAIDQNKLYKVGAKTYPHMDALLAGEPFDMLVNTTDMQAHESLNRKAIVAGKHVWSEKPMANSYAAGKSIYDLAARKGLRFWGAPAVVNSPQFAYMNDALKNKALGTVAAAHGQYGHTGPSWSAFFYEKGGGSMPDLGVYNMATLTGLLGPAKSVMAMTSIVTKERTVDDKGKITVEAEDNAQVLMDHGNGVLSHVMCGFNYFDQHGHEAGKTELHSLQIFGSHGNMRLLGYDWETNGVVMDNVSGEPGKLVSTDKGGYEWQMGATVVGEAIIRQTEPKINAAHALHVLEVIEAARISAASGKKVMLKSTFKWPLF